MINGSPRSWALCLAAVSLGFPAHVAAQTPTCTYDQCALSLRTSWTGEVRVVSGQAGYDVSGVTRSTALAQLFQPNPSAYSHYRNFARRDRLAMQSDYLAGGLLLTGLAVDLFDGPGPSTWSISLDVVGLALYLIGSPVLRTQGMNELSRAVWWYNRGLPIGP